MNLLTKFRGDSAALPPRAPGKAVALAFLGGFSSATSMVIVASIALATMVSNHVVVPLWLALRQGGARSPGDVRGLVLMARRLSIAAILALGYGYYRLSGGSGALAAIGLISFVGVAQILPSMIGGIFWRGATRVGAALGLGRGFEFEQDIYEWRTGICHKPRIKCGDCDHRLLEPLSDSIIYDHLAGEHTIGVYPLLPDDTCHFLAVDFDEQEWRDDARAFICSCKELGVPAALEDFQIRQRCPRLDFLLETSSCKRCSATWICSYQSHLRSNQTAKAGLVRPVVS